MGNHVNFSYEGFVKRTPWETMALVKDKGLPDFVEILAMSSKGQKAAYRKWDKARLFCPNDVLECFRPLKIRPRKIKLTMKIEFDGPKPKIDTRSKRPSGWVEFG